MPTQTFDLAGAVKATHVPITRAILPVFEAIANALDAIDARGGSRGRIDVHVEREELQLGLPIPERGRNLGKITGFVISDNGEGFTDANVESFMSLYSTAKAKRGGKGIGRFTWFKAFSSVAIQSHYYREGRLACRKWEYREGDTVLRDWQDMASSQNSTGSVIKLQGFRREFEGHQQTPKKTKTIAFKIIDHFLARFAHGGVPTMWVADDDEGFDLNVEYESLVMARGEEPDIQIGSQSLSVRYLMMRHHSDLPGKIVYCANSRGVVDEDPSEVVSDVPPVFTGSEGLELALRVYVSGPLLEHANNPYRTGFHLDDGRGRQTRLFPDLPTMEEIREAIRPGVEKFVAPHIAGARAERNSVLDRHLEEAPWYRGLIAANPALRKKIPVNLRGEALELSLYRESIEWRSEVHKKGARLVEELKTEGVDFEKARERLWEQQASLRTGEIDDLARYVTHRRAVLLCLENYLRYTPGTDNHVFEAVAHDLFFRGHTDSNQWAGSYYNHNLWILDDQLAFHRYAVSDKPLKNHSDLGVTEDDRPDICVYSRGVAIERGEDDLDCRTVTIIEFKRPGRNVYGSKDDPILQIKGYAENISKSTVRDKDGQVIQVSEGTRYFGYVIVDPADKIEEFAGNHDMRPLPNGWGWLKEWQNTKPRIVIEVLSFDKVLKMAERRNRALFNLLNLKGEPPKSGR
jgi:hypothetical protein